MYVREPERQIEVLDQVDVLVAGAGVSGCAAAIAAARTGAKTMLLERNGVLGGVATAGLMASIANRYITRDNRIVVQGIAKEVVDRTAARGAASDKWASWDVPVVTIDTEQFKILLIEMQQEAGVQMLTHTMAARPIMDGDTVKGAFIESKMGRQAVLADVVVDATGEADLADQTGCPMRWAGVAKPALGEKSETGEFVDFVGHRGEDGGRALAEMSTSLEFKMGRVDLDALYQHFKRYPETFPVGMEKLKSFPEFERNWVERGIFLVPHGAGHKWDILQQAVESGEFEKERGILYDLDATGLYGLRGLDTVIVNSNFWRVDTLNTPDVSLAELESQKACEYVADFFRRRVPGFERANIVQIATDLGIRTSRGIVGEATLTAEMDCASEPVYLDDVIGCAPARASFKDRGVFWHAHTFDMPYGALLPKRTDNLLVGSGKSVSARPQGVVRGMATCMVLGQAAGCAAALASARGVTPRNLDIRDLQKTLIDQGVYLGAPDRLASLGLS